MWIRGKIKNKIQEKRENSCILLNRIFVTIDVKLVFIVVIGLFQICITCTCLLHDHFRPCVVSIFNSTRENILSEEIYIKQFDPWKKKYCPKQLGGN